MSGGQGPLAARMLVIAAAGAVVRSRYIVVGLVSAAHLLCSALAAGCGAGGASSPASATPSSSGPGSPTPSPPAAPDEVFVGAGDIAQCGIDNAEATAKLLDRIPGTVFTLGDNVQGTGSPEEYTQCYEPTWGRHRWRTFPTIGNHDFEGTGGRPYHAYFGTKSGPVGLAYYSYTLGAWHVVSLNSEIAAGSGSAQYEWLKADLEEAGAACILATWHRPVFSSGPSGGSARMRDVWQLLQQYGADVVLNGHDHDYERFAPQDVDGRAATSGIRQFVVGTGGYPLYGRATVRQNSEVWESRAWGVLRLTLKSGSYSWEFVPIAGQSFSDFGMGSCGPDIPR